MTSTVIVTAYPAPPNSSVVVTLTSPGPNGDRQNMATVLPHGATASFYVCDDMSLSITESPMAVVLPQVPPSPGDAERPATS